MREENVKREMKGGIQTIGGRIKQAIGRFFGHERTEVEGRSAELQGRENIERGAAAERREGAVEETTGKVERSVGEVVGSERMAVEGRAKELEGRERREIHH